jgi:hypothetical protein
MKKQWMNFKDARRFVRSLKLNSVTEWNKYYQSNERLDNIPSMPSRTYKKEWKGMGDWLGVEIIQTQKRSYKKFNESRKFVHTLKLINRNAWIEYCKSGNKPQDIPNNPWHVYGNSGWNGMGDFLGNGNIRNFWPFKKARMFVRKLPLSGSTTWKQYCKSGNKPDNIPAAPWSTYKKEWNGMGDWLGTGNIATQKIQYRKFKDAKELVHKLKISTNIEWRNYCKSGKLPKDIPSNPNNTYKNKGWVNWSDWLGTENISRAIISQNYLPWPQAKIEYRKLSEKYGLKGPRDWKRFAVKHLDELNKSKIPAYPKSVYSKERVWRKEY